MITLSEAQHRLHHLASTHPDRIAPGSGVTDPEGCRYLEFDGTGSCIVGTAFTRELKQVGIRPGTLANISSITELAMNFDLPIEDEALTYLDFAQCQQDGGVPWGRAVAYADEQFAEHLAERQAIEDVEYDLFEFDPDGQLALVA